MNSLTSSKLTIIILTFNSRHIIKSCLENLDFEKHKVIVVDNASSDETVNFIKENFPKTEIIALDKNIGFCRGNNSALEKIDTEFALLLNPDAIILNDDIEKIIFEMKKNPLVALAGPIILDNYPAQQSEIDERIAYINNDYSTIKDCYYEKINDNFSVRFLIGAALFMKVEIMQKIGFLDNNIFLYYDDDELCGRVRKNNYLNLLVPSAFAFHISGGGKSSPASLRIIYKKAWHLSWSKIYWKKLRKGTLRAKRSAFKFTFFYFFKAVFFALKFDLKNSISCLGKMSGAFAFFIGLSAFKKCGNSRG
jgi:GT2 family glycosyltransferase